MGVIESHDFLPSTMTRRLQHLREMLQEAGHVTASFSVGAHTLANRSTIDDSRCVGHVGAAHVGLWTPARFYCKRTRINDCALPIVPPRIVPTRSSSY